MIEGNFQKNHCLDGRKKTLLFAAGRNINKVNQFEEYIKKHIIVQILFECMCTTFFSWIATRLFQLNISAWKMFVISAVVCAVIIILLHTKKCSFTKKKNKNINLELGYDSIDTKGLLLSAKKNIFFVAITNNGIISPPDFYRELLDKGVTINILLEDNEELLQKMCCFFYGADVSEVILKKNRHEVELVKSAFFTFPQFINYLRNGKINIRRCKTIISTAFVAIDLEGYNRTISDNGKIIASFYQYRKATDLCPTIYLTHDSSKKLYDSMGESILDLWKDAEPIDIEKLYETYLSEG